jgi:hypothetical protein
VPPIVVEPEVLSGAGESIDAVGEELAAALSTLSAGLPNGAMAGHDKAGLAFGQAYQQAGQALLDAGARVGKRGAAGGLRCADVGHQLLARRCLVDDRRWCERIAEPDPAGQVRHADSSLAVRRRRYGAVSVVDGAVVRRRRLAER